MPSHANPVNWFEIPVADLPRAKNFYETVLEVALTDSEMGPNRMAWFTLEKINAGGGKTLMPRMDIGQHGFIAHFEDSEGNRVGLHESPAGA